MKNSLTPSITRNTETVHHFSNHALTNRKRRSWVKAHNSAITPRLIPKEEIIANIEANLRRTTNESFYLQTNATQLWSGTLQTI